MNIAKFNLSKLYLISFLLSLGLMLIIYIPVLTKMVNNWYSDPNYSHGFLIPLISFYMIWQKRSLFKTAKISPSPKGLFLIAIAGATFILGKVAGEYFSQRISFVLMLTGFALAFGGVTVWSKLKVPILYLLFMVPFPYIVYNKIAFPLKILATKISTILLQSLNIPIYSEGNLIFLPSSTLEIADACSGINSLISILAISTLIALFTRFNSFYKVLLILISIPVVLLSNIVRIVLNALWQPSLYYKPLHFVSGQLVFIFAIILICFIVVLIRKWICFDDMVQRHNTTNKEIEWQFPSRETRSGEKIVPLLAVAIFILVLGASNFATAVQSVELKRPLHDLPIKIDGFSKIRDFTLSKKVVDKLGVDAYIMRSYSSMGSNLYNIVLYIGYYKQQKEGEMIHSPKHCYPGSGWHLISSRKVAIMLKQEGKKITINQMIVQKGREKQLVHYWYYSRGRVVASEYLDRFYMVLDSIMRNRSDGALIRISGPLTYDIEYSREKQIQFIQSLMPIVDQFFVN